MAEVPLDLSRVFVLEPHGPDTYIGESPPYAWGRIYGGLVIAQALWAATQTVRDDHFLHSMHAYFVLAGDPAEPVRYEVDRLRNGRSFSTRAVVARQSSGAILTLSCSFQTPEDGPVTQSFPFPEGQTPPASEEDCYADAGTLRADVLIASSPPRALSWCRYPGPLPDDGRVHDCALAYLSDLNPMTAIKEAHPNAHGEEAAWYKRFMSASLDHAMWFQRQARADEWLLLDMAAHGLIRTRGLATGPVFSASGAHIATIAQEGLLRERRNP
ncbi:MAG: acyl-CoA thioesterase II [Chromatiales bacterium]|jgi:acyl-CoA thioesterase II|nr:acyl-CoA thioesterase II [Chromatiales bacterium]